MNLYLATYDTTKITVLAENEAEVHSILKECDGHFVEKYTSNTGNVAIGNQLQHEGLYYDWSYGKPQLEKVNIEKIEMKPGIVHYESH